LAGYDIIGDVHGHASRLKSLLKEMGYHQSAAAWQHAERTAIFVGDLIDRGPEQLETLHLVRDMVEAGAARVVMGNHELNAIAYAAPDPDAPSQFLRHRHGDRGAKNTHQHRAFLAEVGLDTAEHRTWVEWFKTIPVWIEEPEFRVVHACWHPAHIAILSPELRDDRLTEELITTGHRRGTAHYLALETLLKGPEIRLPDGYGFTDKDGHSRQEIRTRWWDDGCSSFRDAYIGPDGVDIPDLPLAPDATLPPPDRPVFIGHYWLDPESGLAPLAPKVACVDYSVAKGGPMVAYRWDGESTLMPTKFVAA